MSTKSNPDELFEDTRQRIISAAMHLFGQMGYSQATTKAIADAAGVNEVTLFRHFGTKMNLLTACIEAFNESSFAASFSAQLTGNYPDDIYLMAQLQIQDTTSRIDILRLLLCEARSQPELREAMLAGGRGNLDRISAYFQQEIEAGIVRSEYSAELLASAFDSLFSSPVLFKNFFQDSLSLKLPTAELIRPLVNLFVRGTQTKSD
jgi:AcrR family transcriptional regulator